MTTHYDPKPLQDAAAALTAEAARRYWACPEVPLYLYCTPGSNGDGGAVYLTSDPWSLPESVRNAGIPLTPCPFKGGFSPGPAIPGGELRHIGSWIRAALSPAPILPTRPDGAKLRVIFHG